MENPNVQSSWKWLGLTIHPPLDSPYSKEETISGWCIRCWEAGVDDGLEWILFTTVKVQDAEDALQQLDWYSWKIVRISQMHEDWLCHRETAARDSIRVISIIGIFGNCIRSGCCNYVIERRTTPELPASKLIPIKCLKVLVAHLNLPDDNLTTAEFWKSIVRERWFHWSFWRW